MSNAIAGRHARRFLGVALGMTLLCAQAVSSYATTPAMALLKEADAVRLPDRGGGLGAILSRDRLVIDGKEAPGTVYTVDLLAGNSPLRTTTIKSGDVILAINGVVAETPLSFSRHVRSLTPGTSATLLVTREGMQTPQSVSFVVPRLSQMQVPGAAGAPPRKSSTGEACVRGSLTGALFILVPTAFFALFDGGVTFVASLPSAAKAAAVGCVAGTMSDAIASEMYKPDQAALVQRLM